MQTYYTLPQNLSAKQKKCAAKGLQNKQKKKVVLVLDSNPCQYPQQLQGVLAAQLFILWFCSSILPTSTGCSGQTKPFRSLQ